MSWRVVVRPEVERDVAEAVTWYNSQQEELGKRFREEIIEVFDALKMNPLLNCRRHARKNIRWRFPTHFPYRVIYEVLETEKVVVIAAVLHAAWHDMRWQRRV
jgi:toxin ParE1/3/4